MQFYNFVNKGEQETDLYITGDIVDDNQQWLYEWFEEDCTAPKAFKEELDKHSGKKINVIIDSYGGSVFAASTIYTLLSTRKGETVCKVSGIAASAASVIAMAGDKLLMSPTSMLMIHNPLTYVEGDQHDMRKAADTLDAVKESIINAYERKTNLSREKISKLMDKETWLDYNEAKELGFADGVWGEDTSFFDKEVLNSIKDQRIAVYNKVKFNPENKSVETKGEVVDAVVDIKPEKATIEKFNEMLDKSGLRETPYAIFEANGDFHFGTEEEANEVNRRAMEIKAMEAEFEFMKLKRKMA